MKKLLMILVAATFTMSFVGCLDIMEEITVNKDGSGHYVSTIDAAKMSEQISMLAAMDSTGEMIPKFKYSMDSTFVSTADATKKMSGISNYKLDTSKPFFYVISYDFKDVKSLNDAIGKDKKAAQQGMYAWEKGKITRNDVPFDLGGMGDMGGSENKEMMKGFMQDMKYKVIINLPGKAKDVSNKSFTLSEDKKVVTLETNFADIMDGKVKVGSEVKYK